MGATIARRFGWVLAPVLAAGAALAADEPEPTAPATVTIQARGIRLDDALQRMRDQTGEALTDLRGRFGVEAANPTIDLDLKAAPLLRALDEVAAGAGVTVTPYTGDGSVGIVAGDGGGAERPPTEYVGPFRVAIESITLVRDFQTGMSAANVAFEVAWEPRIRPMLLAMKAGGVEAVDDHGRAIRPLIASESGATAVHPENSAAELDATLAAPERSAAKLATLRARIEATVPADVKTFRFPRIDETRTVREGDVAATLQAVEVDEQIWRIAVALEYPGEGPGFESFRQGLFDNRIRLEKADGSKFALNGGSSSVGGVGGELVFEYLFEDVPGEPRDYRLVYEAPGKFVAVPIDVAFKDVPLP